MASAATTAAAEWEAEARKVLVARKPAFGLPTGCPTCLPALLYLRMAKVPFDIHVDTSFPDADHIPYVEFGECVAFNNEKGGVIEYLKEEKIVDLTSNLPSDSYPDLLSTKAMVSTWLADALQYELWVVTDRSVAQDIYFSDLSWPIGKILHWKKTRDVKQLLGITKLNAAEREDEIYQKANAAYDALSMRLGDQAFLFDNRPTDVDALFLGHVLFVLNALPGTSTLRSYLQNHDNLVNFAERMKVQLVAVDSSSGGSGSSAPSSSSMPRKGTSSGQTLILAHCLVGPLLVEMLDSLFSHDPKMFNEKKPDEIIVTGVLESLQNFLRKCVTSVLSYGPMPKHIAFIMDGNRRYAKSRSIKEGTGHRVGFSALMASLLYCHEMGVKYITVYAFSIDNFKRGPTEVQTLMELMEEKINELLENRNVINKVNCKINFWGSLDMLTEPVRLAAQKLMASTAQNTGLVFSVCMPYNSTSEIANAVNELCKERRDMIQGQHAGSCNGQTANGGTRSDISVADLDRHMYTAGCPDPDIVIRTSGETRLSNFLLWQSTFSHLQNPDPLWPEFSWRHLVWAILQYQRVYPYIEQNKTLAKKQL